MEYLIYNSPIGELIIKMNKSELVGLYFKDLLKSDYDSLTFNKNHIVTRLLDSYFNGYNIDFKQIKINPEGTEYRKYVWNELINIPYGQTISYKELSDRLVKKGVKSSPRSVGGAVGANPIAIIVPCHRVIGSDGSITGYSGGISRKEYLLSLEESK